MPGRTRFFPGERSFCDLGTPNAERADGHAEPAGGPATEGGAGTRVCYSDAGRDTGARGYNTRNMNESPEILENWSTHSHFADDANNGETFQSCRQLLVREYRSIRARPAIRFPDSGLESMPGLGHPVIWLISNAG